jgi:hypothetical protein
MFAALRVRDYRIYWSTGVISNVGTAMQGTALDWYMLSITHSGTAVGWTTGLQFAPVLLFGLWGGVLADRWPRRRLLLTAQSLYALQALVLTIAVLSGHAPPWLIYLLAFGLGCVFTVENPTRLSFVAELVGAPLIPNAAGLNILSLNAARLIGPARTPQSTGPHTRDHGEHEPLKSGLRSLCHAQPHCTRSEFELQSRWLARRRSRRGYSGWQTGRPCRPRPRPRPRTGEG